MAIQKSPEFFVKAESGMVLFLGIDIANGVFHLRNPNRENTVGILPGERSPRQMIIQLFRRSTFDQLHSFRNLQSGRQGEQSVHMVQHSANRERLEFVGPSNSADVCPELRLHGLGNNGLAVLGREDAMDQNTFIAV